MANSTVAGRVITAPGCDVSVLIVGGGPIGLALAADLGRYGVQTLLVEKRSDKLGPAKMLEVGVRTMEFCRRLGVADEVRNWGFPPDHPLDSVFITNFLGYELGRVYRVPLAAQRSSPYSPERSMPCPQTWFDPILQRRARSFPTNVLRYQVELEDLEQDDTGVTARLRDLQTGRIEHVRAAYVVGCDGFQSTVRELLGIEIRGQRHVDWSMNVYIRIPTFASLTRIAPAYRYVFVGPEGSWSFLTMIDGKDLFRLQLFGVDADALEKTDIDPIVTRCFGQRIPYTVEERTLWVRKMTIADRFMDGRIFLAGDSAHAHPPSGGLGMNTGLQDAFDLSWKLAAVLSGWGGQHLLDSYEYERRPASSRATEVSLVNYYRLTGGSRHPSIDDDTAEGREARRRVGEHLVGENEKSWNPPGVHLGYIYNPSPIVVSDDTARPADDTVGYVQTSYPGARAPHVWLGPDTSTLDLFGDAFVLLNFGEASTVALESAAQERGVPLRVYRLFNREAAEIYEKRLVLVRPDGHVAWRGDDVPRDPLSLIDTVRGAGSRSAACRAGLKAVPAAPLADAPRQSKTESIVNIVSICGSLRQGSYNLKLARTLPELSPPSMLVQPAPPIGDIPLYNEDVKERGFPASVLALGDAIRRADGVIIVTPEYNFSVPGVLKNAIDWVSRLPDQPFANKPVAIASASQGVLGGARAQYHLRQMMVFLEALVFNKPEVFVAAAHTKFDKATGLLTDEPTLAIIRQQLEAFARFVEAQTGRRIAANGEGHAAQNGAGSAAMKA
jgi:2-polyprenyl-6-methoxyphenol hydroxylase-like FAD-dependent oxidoreductase/NAD(P)H-dependent FMN reductase